MRFIHIFISHRKKTKQLANLCACLDDSDLPSDDEATKTVDQLVAESEEDFEHRSVNGSEYMSRSSTPSVPPGFGPPGLGPPGLGPPGFGINHAHPMAASREEPIAKPTSRIVPTSAPFTPGRSTAFIPRAATPLSHVSVPTTPAMPAAVIAIPAAPAVPAVQAAPVVPAVVPEPPVSQAKQDVKALAAKTGLSTTIAAQSAKPALQSEDFPALDSGKGKAVSTPGPKAAPAKTPLPVFTKKVPVLASAQPIPAASKAAEKRAAAALNISVPSKPTPKPVVVSENITVPVVAASAFPPLPASTPGPIVQSPMPRAAPKTLRLTSTTKVETPTAGSATPSSATLAYPASLLPSRQASLVLNARTDRPGTPTSELISDNASITSASISRPNSPPIANRIGSAPVRVNTKSMAKKQRREKGKELTEAEIAAAKVAEPEVEIAPLMGRKKKVKKERTIHSAAGGSTPAVSRPQSPGPAESPSVVQTATANNVEPPTVIKSRKPSLMEPEVKSIAKTVDVRGKDQAKTPVSSVVDLNPSVVEAEEEALDKPIPTPAAVFHDLLSAQIIDDAEGLFLLKPPVVYHRNQDPPIDMQSVNQKLTITPEDRATLLAGLPVHKIADGPNRIMLTPNGDCVRNLTPEEEMRYLDLQSAISEESGATAFVSPKHHANNGFTLIGGRAVPNGPPSFFPIFNSSAPPMDPVSKIQRDEALSYINQYVLPSLSTNSQLEKALNANALDTEILRSTSDSAAWATWGTDPASTNPNNRDGRDGMLGLEHMTAQFAVSGDNRGQPLGNVSLLSLNEAESAMQLARKETDGLEKRLNALIKKNRRLLLGSGH